MITIEELTRYIQQAMPDAEVTVNDRTGTLDHFQVHIVSQAFKGHNLMDRQRMVYRALNEPMQDGRIHALEIRTETKD